MGGARGAVRAHSPQKAEPVGWRLPWATSKQNKVVEQKRRRRNRQPGSGVAKCTLCVGVPTELIGDVTA